MQHQQLGLLERPSNTGGSSRPWRQRRQQRQRPLASSSRSARWCSCRQWTLPQTTLHRSGRCGAALSPASCRPRMPLRARCAALPHVPASGRSHLGRQASHSLVCSWWGPPTTASSLTRRMRSCSWTRGSRGELSSQGGEADSGDGEAHAVHARRQVMLGRWTLGVSTTQRMLPSPTPSASPGPLLRSLANWASPRALLKVLHHATAAPGPPL